MATTEQRRDGKRLGLLFLWDELVWSMNSILCTGMLISLYINVQYYMPLSCDTCYDYHALIQCVCVHVCLCVCVCTYILHDYAHNHPETAHAAHSYECDDNVYTIKLFNVFIG